MDWNSYRKFKKLDNTPRGLTGIEDPMWYDGIAYYEDAEGNRYSRNGNPIEEYEMCKPGFIFETIIVTDGPDRFDYHYEVTNVRPDTIWQTGKRSDIKPKILRRNINIYNRLH